MFHDFYLLFDQPGIILIFLVLEDFVTDTLVGLYLLDDGFDEVVSFLDAFLVLVEVICNALVAEVGAFGAVREGTVEGG